MLLEEKNAQNIQRYKYNKPFLSLDQTVSSVQDYSFLWENKRIVK